MHGVAAHCPAAWLAGGDDTPDGPQLQPKALVVCEVANFYVDNVAGLQVFPHPPTPCSPVSL